MKIQINPRSLLNLENICEVLYKLHPFVLNFLVRMERDLGPVLGFIDMENLTPEQRKILDCIYNVNLTPEQNFLNSISKI